MDSAPLPDKAKEGIGPIIGSLIILSLLVFGAVRTLIDERKQAAEERKIQADIRALGEETSKLQSDIASLGSSTKQ